MPTSGNEFLKNVKQFEAAHKEQPKHDNGHSR